jgi:lysophospholipase L1-like esterase
MTRAIAFIVATLASLLFLSCGTSAESFTYLALGDSLAAGTGASDPLTRGYVPLVHAHLGDEVELVNLGVGGATSADILEEGDQLDQALEVIGDRANDDDDGNDVEVITIDIGGNDLLPLTREGSPCLIDPLPAACLEEIARVMSEYEDNLSQTLRALRGAALDTRIVVVTLFNPLLGSGSSLEQTADVAIAQFNALVTRVAKDPEVEAEVADVAAPFKERASEVISADGIHPNDTGYAVMAAAVIPALEGR